MFLLHLKFSCNISKLIQGHDVEVIKVYFGKETPIEEMCEKLGNPDIIIAGSMITYNGELFRRLPRLKAVIRWGYGL